MTTRTARLLAAALVCALAALPASAQRTKGLDDLTHRGVSLDEIVANVAKQAEETRGRQKALLIWLVDNTKAMADSKQHQLLGEAIVKHFGARPGKGTRSAATVEHAVVLIDAQLKMIQSPTADPAAVKSALDGVAAKPQSAIRDTMAAINACVVGFARRRASKSVVLFTVENGDTESEMENAARALRRSKTRLYVISREGLVSDSYWKRRASEADKHKPLRLEGAESPMIELPWGVLFMIRDPHESAPAGFGIYGLNRLVSESGGAYYLYDPVVAPSSDSRCQAIYNDFALSRHQPPAVSRAQYSSMVSRSPYWRLTREAWTAAYALGIVSCLPPKLQGSAAGKMKTPSRKSLSWSMSTIDRAAAEAVERRVELQGWIDKLAALPEVDAKADAFDRRAKATADCLRFTLMVSRFNLLQLIGYAKLVKVLRTGKPRSDLELGVVPEGASQVVISYYNRTFCEEGARAMEETLWLGGEAATAEMKTLTAELRKLRIAHQASPYAVIAARNAVVYFRLYVPVTGTGTTDRKRETSNMQGGETTDAPESRPARARSGGASRTGSGTTTTK